MKVKVMSRKEAEAREWVEGDHLISIYGAAETKPSIPHFVERAFLQFDDDSQSMQAKHATTAFLFAASCSSDVLFIHCTAGISRSAGVAEALHRIGLVEWDDRDAQVWQANGRKGPRYMPNAHVVSLMMRAAGATPLLRGE